MHARLDRGTVKLLTRTGLDWTHKYPAIAEAVSSIGARQAYLDGELCGVFPDGVTSFSMIRAASDAGNAAGLVYFIFDLLHLDGEEPVPRARHSDRPGRRGFRGCHFGHRFILRSRQPSLGPAFLPCVAFNSNAPIRRLPQECTGLSLVALTGKGRINAASLRARSFRVTPSLEHSYSRVARHRSARTICRP